jgi:hypothetical protein
MFMRYFRSYTKPLMLFKQKLVDKIAEAIEGIAVASVDTKSAGSVFVYHPQRRNDTPIVEITYSEADDLCRVLIQSALGTCDLTDVRDVRISDATREVAFMTKERNGRLTMATVSSYGVIQVYSNISTKLAKKDVAKVAPDDLRAAIALKLFTERPKK